MKAEEVYSKLKKMIGLVSVGIRSTSSTKNPDGSVTITINFVSGSPLSFTMSPVKGDKGTGIKDALIKEIQNGENTEYHLMLIDDKNNNIDAGKIPVSSGEVYDDTQIKSDINDLKSDKQDKTDNSLETTDKTLVGAINTINGNQLDTVTFSADYKNIILNRKNGLNPYTIPIASIINNAKITELNDVDDTDIGNGKTIVYDATTKKHKYVDSTGTDELVKMDGTTDAKYLTDLIDKSTIVNDNGTLKVKKLDGQEVSISEINYLKGLTMNIMDLVSAFANGGVKVWETPVNTYADLSTLDRSTFIDGMCYIVYVLADETHSGAKTTYLCDKTSSTFFGNADSQRNFLTNPIDLANEVTGKLGTSNIDVDSLWTLLTINDTYKTLTSKDEVFGTHGAKALYDELVTAIGNKANSSDITTHTGDTDIHITSAERTKWDKVTDKVDKTDIVDNLTSTDIDKPLSANQGKVLKSMIITLTGVVLPYAGNTVPTGFLLCNGQAVSRTEYQNLFDAIGTTYGEGDGSTTFNLPNLKDKFVQGAGTNAVGTEMSAGLPNITGEVGYLKSAEESSYYNGINTKNGCFANSRQILTDPHATKLVSSKTQDDIGETGLIDFNASSSNSIYGNSNTVQPPAVAMNYIIKY